MNFFMKFLKITLLIALSINTLPLFSMDKGAEKRQDDKGKEKTTPPKAAAPMPLQQKNFKDKTPADLTQWLRARGQAIERDKEKQEKKQSTASLQRTHAGAAGAGGAAAAGQPHINWDDPLNNSHSQEPTGAAGPDLHQEDWPTIEIDDSTPQTPPIPAAPSSSSSSKRTIGAKRTANDAGLPDNDDELDTSRPEKRRRTNSSQPQSLDEEFDTTTTDQSTTTAAAPAAAIAAGLAALATTNSSFSSSSPATGIMGDRSRGPSSSLGAAGLDAGKSMDDKFSIELEDETGKGRKKDFSRALLLAKSNYFKTALEQDEAATSLRFSYAQAKNFKSVTLDELEGLLTDPHRYVASIIDGQKVIDICHLANYLHIPTLLNGTISTIANSLSRNMDQNAVTACKTLPSDIQRTIVAKARIVRSPVKELLCKATLNYKTRNFDQKGTYTTWHPTNAKRFVSYGDWLYRRANPIIRILDVSGTTTSAQELRGHSGTVIDAAWHPTNRYTLASCAADKTIRIWDLSAKIPSSTVLVGHTDWVYKIFWHPSNPNILISVGDQTIRRWDLSSKIPTSSIILRHDAKRVRAALHPTEPNTLAIACDTIVKITRNLFDDVPTFKDITGHTNRISHIAWHPTNPHVLASQQRRADDKYGSGPGESNDDSDAEDPDNTIRLWNLSEDIPKSRVLAGQRAHDCVANFAWNPKLPHMLASCTYDGTIRIWDCSRTAPRLMHELEGDSRLYTISWHPRKPNLLVSVSINDTIKIWDLSSNTPSSQVIKGGSDHLPGPWHQTNGNVIASSAINKIIIHDLKLLFECQKDLSLLTFDQAIGLNNIFSRIAARQLMPHDWQIIFSMPRSIMHALLLRLQLPKKQIRLLMHLYNSPNYQPLNVEKQILHAFWDSLPLRTRKFIAMRMPRNKFLKKLLDIVLRNNR